MRERTPGTPAQETARARAWASFRAIATARGHSNTVTRCWLAEEMGIEERYAIIYDMDEVECATVIEICNDAMPKATKKKAAQRGRLS